MVLKSVDETHMADAFRKLQNGRAAGPDKVFTTIIRSVRDLV